MNRPESVSFALLARQLIMQLLFFLLTITPDLAAILPIILHGHFIADMTLYHTIEPGKDISLYRPDDRGMSHTNISY